MSTPACRFVLVLVTAAALPLVLGGCGRRHVTAAAPASMAKAPHLSVHAESKPPKPGEPAAPEAAPKLKVMQKQVAFKWMEHGQVRMTATASSLSGDDINRIGVLTNFRGKLYDKGKFTATVEAPKAVADMVKRTVTATGGVTMKSVERATVAKCPRVKWFEKTQQVVGDGGVSIKSATLGDMTGAAFQADTGLKTLRVMDSAKGIKL